MSESILNHFKDLKSKGLNIDITRGKPDSSQLDLSNKLLKMNVEPITDDGVDLRNYGEPSGIKAARELGASLLDAPIGNIIAGEQSSLLLSYQTILAHYIHGKPFSWKSLEKPKFICPVPGFDRHFRIFDDFDIEVITVPLIEDGVDLAKLKNVLDENQNVMGIICVPRHSNPSGEVYTDENINGIFSIGKAYSDKFLFLFDHAYLIHDFLPTKKQTPTWQLALNNNTNNQTVIVTSFSKVTFGGGGLSFLAADGDNLDLIKKTRLSMVICPDKINQQRHVDLFKNKEDIKSHMTKHANLIRPKFETSYEILGSISDDYGTFSKPTGGYFITYKTSKPIASEVIELCSVLGVSLTPAGATFPNSNDPNNNIIRIAPTFIEEDELKIAMDVFITSVQVAHLGLKT
jgi:DNA-binding transcriptional MocR family regulator